MTRRWLAVAVAVALAAGCSSGDDDATVTTTVTSPVATATTSADATTLATPPVGLFCGVTANDVTLATGISGVTATGTVGRTCTFTLDVDGTPVTLAVTLNTGGRAGFDASGRAAVEGGLAIDNLGDVAIATVVDDQADLDVVRADDWVSVRVVGYPVAPGDATGASHPAVTLCGLVAQAVLNAL